VLKAGVQLFSKQGFDGTTTLEIAEEAHVTEPVVYYHFKNKDGFSPIFWIKLFQNIFPV